MIKLILCMYLINISCNKFLFFKKNENILMTKKDGSTVFKLVHA